ncbi:MAG: PQQ-dependent catabolism-associated CXXCW motif protein [Hyphomicrobium sp.]
MTETAAETSSLRQLGARRRNGRIAVLAVMAGLSVTALGQPMFAADTAAPAAAPDKAPVDGPDHAKDIKDIQAAPSAPAAPVPEPADYRTDGYRTPVPATLKGAKVITAEQANELWSQKAAIFIDVYPQAPKPPNLPAGTFWREPKHLTIEAATWLPNVGYGVIAPAVEDYFKRHLEALTGGDKSKPIVMYCLRNCWMSWNAAKRAMTYGYSNIIWYPDGTDAWQEIGQHVVEVKPAP